MKRIISFVLVLATILTLSACGGGKKSSGGNNALPAVKGTVYTGTVDGIEAEIIIDGTTAVVKRTMVQDEGSAVISTSTALYGTITETDGKTVIAFNKLVVSLKITGEQAKAMKEALVNAYGAMIQDADEKQKFIDIYDGKTVTVTSDDTLLWGGMFVGTYDVTVVLNKTDKTFVQEAEWG